MLQTCGSSCIRSMDRTEIEYKCANFDNAKVDNVIPKRFESRDKRIITLCFDTDSNEGFFENVSVRHRALLPANSEMNSQKK